MSKDRHPCYCGSDKKASLCCLAIIEGREKAQSAEQLMRSRFSAYCIKDYAYILKTYAQEQRVNLSLETLKEHDHGSVWLALDVETSELNSVTFRAYYRVAQQYFCMHERSQFEIEDGDWVYSTGQIQADSGAFKPSRNQACFCGSGLKFKRCCGQK